MHDLTLIITRSDGVEYEATSRIVFGTTQRRDQITAIGAQLPVRIAATDPSRVAIDMAKLDKTP